MLLLSSASGAASATSRAAPAPARLVRVAPAVSRASVRVHATGTAVSRPTPVVKIDNTSDAFATVVTIDFGKTGKLGELLDAVTALKNLGLNIRKAKVAGKGNATTFFITDAETSEKIVRSARLEDIRMTVIHSLMDQFPETSDAFGLKASVTDSDPSKVLGVSRQVIQTTIDVDEASNGSCSVLKITTADRPGLLVDIVRVLKDINLNVVSAEIDTVGSQAQDEFFVTYHGEPLSSPMVLLVTNALQYYLSLAEVAKEESY